MCLKFVGCIFTHIYLIKKNMLMLMKCVFCRYSINLKWYYKIVINNSVFLVVDKRKICVNKNHIVEPTS